MCLVVGEADQRIMVRQVEVVATLGGGGSGTRWKQAGGEGGSYCNGEDCSGLAGGNSNDDGLVQIIELFGSFQNVS